MSIVLNTIHQVFKNKTSPQKYKLQIVSFVTLNIIYSKDLLPSLGRTYLSLLIVVQPLSNFWITNIRTIKRLTFVVKNIFIR